MSKISLTYENKTYRLEVSGEMIKEFRSYEEALGEFEKRVSELDNSEEGKWLSMVDSLKGYDEEVSINNEFKSMEYKGVKYFLKTDKAFYMEDGDMIPLLGGFNFFKALVVLDKNNEIGDVKEFMIFLKRLSVKRVNYRLNELSLLVLGAMFNYGSAEFNFQSKKLNKGASIVDCTFGEFKEYILGIVK
ncbi:MAG: hypothetical protein ACRC30_09240 [Clostridium sp.]